MQAVNKAKQHQSLRSLDSLALVEFVHGFAIFAQIPQSQVCRYWRRYIFQISYKGDSNV